jgi:hypothetical protein
LILSLSLLFIIELDNSIGDEGGASIFFEYIFLKRRRRRWSMYIFTKIS